MNEFGKEIGNSIKKLRVKKGFTAKELSEKTGKKSSYISRLENGLIKNPRLKTVKELLSGLGVKVKSQEDLLKIAYTSQSSISLDSVYENNVEGEKNIKSNNDFIQSDDVVLKAEISHKSTLENSEKTDLIFNLSSRKELALELMSIANELKNNGQVLMDRTTYNPLADNLKTHFDSCMRRLELYAISYNLYTEKLIKDKVEV